MTCVDWTRALRPASFRGVPFYVESDEAEVGRRLVVHEFPNRDRPFVEDMGEKARRYSVSAYIAHDGLLAHASALVRACATRGPGTLVLPTDGSMLVRCQSCKRQHARDKLGYLAFQLDFVEAGLGLAATPIPLLQLLVGVSAAAAISSITASFFGAYSAIRADAWVVSNAVSMVRSWATTVDAVRMRTPMQPTAAAAVRQAVEAYHTKAPALVRDGRDSVDIRGTSLGLSSSPAPAGGIVTEAAAILDALREGAAPADAAEAFYDLASYGVPDPTPLASGISATQDVANEIALNRLYRRLALLNLAQAAADAEWGDRPTAVRWRARVAELFERELHGAHGGDVYAALEDVRGKAAEAISRTLADLQPVVTVDASTITPSVVWSYRLYEDAAQATDLINRNRVRHPSFMPQRFQAKAPPENAALTAAERRIGAGS